MMNKFVSFMQLIALFSLQLLQEQHQVVFVNGWGHDGHVIVANIAYRKLSNHTKHKIKKILNISHDDNANNDDDDDMTPLGLIANWADVVRYTKAYSWSTPLHFIDIQDELIHGGCPCTNATGSSNNVTSDDNMNVVNNNNTSRKTSLSLSKCQFVYKRDCQNNTCVAGAIVNYTNNLLLAFKNNKKSNAGMFMIDDDVTSSSTRRRNQLRGADDQLQYQYYQSLQQQQSLLLLQQQQQQQQEQNQRLVQESLKFLTHFIGDIHQPLHVSRKSDIGGNTFHVYFNDTTSSSSSNSERNHSSHHHHKEEHYNLHSVWDVGIIKRTIHTYYNDSRLLFEYDIEKQQLNDQEETTETDCFNGRYKKCVMLWGKESWYYASSYAYRNPIDDSSSDDNLQRSTSSSLSSSSYECITNGTILTDLYYNISLPIVKQRLFIASQRLAYTLEHVFSHL